MFGTSASSQTTAGFTGRDDAAVVDIMSAAARQQNVMCAREMAAMGELYARRAPESQTDKELWALDGHAELVAELSAALRISRGRAHRRLQYAIALRERLPRFAEVFARGDVDFRVMAAVVNRTELVYDPAVVAKLDKAIAAHAGRWMRLSAPKLAERIDMWVARFDPAGTRVPGERNEDRYVSIEPIGSGLAGVWAQLHGADGVALDSRLDALAGTVCPDDPRTKKQRRADALGALVAGLDAMRCLCGSPDCAAARRSHGTEIVIHVLAEQAAVSGEADAPGYLPGFGPVPPAMLRQLAQTAKTKPLLLPPACPERGYRPSTALAEFIRCRDLTCRFPDCDQPAAVCQIDHTVPWPLGPTHPSNLKLLCVSHHLLKTFYTGARGWSDRQLADGTVIWTSPSGQVYTTHPDGAVFFPVLGSPTGELTIKTGDRLPDSVRGLMMPRRRCTRAQDRERRFAAERRINEERLARERRIAHRRRRKQELLDKFHPPPF